jgi:hypothetical protein
LYKNLKLKNNELDDPMISYVSIDEHEISQFSIFVMSIFLVTWDLILTWPAQILAHFQMLECYINMCYIYFGTVPGNEILYYMLECYINMTYNVHIFWGCWNVILTLRIWILALWLMLESYIPPLELHISWFCARYGEWL